MLNEGPVKRDVHLEGSLPAFKSCLEGNRPMAVRFAECGVNPLNHSLVTWLGQSPFNSAQSVKT